MRGTLFYGWYIVGVGFLANLASAFSLASTLSVFLKPLSEELGVSRGVFSLLRSGESLIGAAMAPLVGAAVDRFGGRHLMVAGAIVAGAGYLLLSRVETFWQFVLVRWGLVSVGDCLFGSMVINVVIARWFYRRRGRALALSSMGIGSAKVVMPLFAASLLLGVGWRGAWAVFGLLTSALVVGPALLFVRREPDGLSLDRDDGSARREAGSPVVSGARQEQWSRREALRTRAFWLTVTMFGISGIGVTGLNLHVFPYVSDLGHPPLVAATVMSAIALMQLLSPLAWGLLAERLELSAVLMMKFFVQAAGLCIAIAESANVAVLYAGFLLYGAGLGGSMVLPDLVLAGYFGRLSLGRIRGVAVLITHALAAIGPPFFGFLFDLSGSYWLSFALFASALFVSGVLSLYLRPPRRPRAEPRPAGA